MTPTERTDKRRSRLAAAGICIDCGEAMASNGMLCCRDCRSFRADRERERQGEIRALKHCVISTIIRGNVDPPEPLDAQNQAKVNESIAWETLDASLERDPPLSKWREKYLAKHPVRGERGMGFHYRRLERGA